MAAQRNLKSKYFRVGFRNPIRAAAAYPPCAPQTANPYFVIASRPQG
jgi:hypothetical protein